MATYLIQVKNGTDTVGIVNPLAFKNAVYFTDSVGNDFILINSTFGAYMANVTTTSSLSEYAIPFSSTQLAYDALEQLYIDLNAYYNA
jgi:hypothetical protein